MDPINMNTTQTVLENVCDIVAQRGMSTADLARLADLDRSTLANRLQSADGIGAMTIREFSAISDALAIDMATLVTARPRPADRTRTIRRPVDATAHFDEFEG